MNVSFVLNMPFSSFLFSFLLLILSSFLAICLNFSCIFWFDNTVWSPRRDWIQFIHFVQVCRITRIMPFLQNEVLYCLTSISIQCLSASIHTNRTLSRERWDHSLSSLLFTKQEKCNTKEYNKSEKRNKMCIKLPQYITLSRREDKSGDDPQEEGSSRVLSQETLQAAQKRDTAMAYSCLEYEGTRMYCESNCMQSAE